MRIPKLILASLVVVLLFGFPAVATAQAVTSTEVFTAPFSLTLIPADYPCLQEVIVIDGTLHYVVRITLDASGGRHRATLINAQGLTALGLDTGIVYRVSGPGHLYFNDDDLAAPVRERRFYDLIHVVGPGDVAKLLVRTGFHVTFNNDGEMVAFTETESVKCQ